MAKAKGDWVSPSCAKGFSQAHPGAPALPPGRPPGSIWGLSPFWASVEEGPRRVGVARRGCDTEPPQCLCPALLRSSSSSPSCPRSSPAWPESWARTGHLRPGRASLGFGPAWRHSSWKSPRLACRSAVTLPGKALKLGPARTWSGNPRHSCLGVLCQPAPAGRQSWEPPHRGAGQAPAASSGA